MAPELLPVTKTLLASPLYVDKVYVTMLAIEFESPYYDQYKLSSIADTRHTPPLCVRADLDDTSQQVPLYGDSG